MFNLNYALVINLTRYSSNISINVDKVYRQEYDKKIAVFLMKVCEKKKVNYIDVGTLAIHPPQWNIEAMSIIPYLVTAISEELDIDIFSSTNPFLDDIKDLHDYKVLF